MISFYEMENIIESVLGKDDFTGQSLAQRMAQGRDIGEDFIRWALSQNGVEITPSKAKQDMHEKIDGYWNGEAVQIKLRRSSRGQSNDIAFEVVRNHDSSQPLINQLQNPQQHGRDWKGQAKHYFVMNQQETEIYHVLAEDLKRLIGQAVESLQGAPLSRPLKFQGVDLRPTQDRDPESFTPTKVMAFVPVNLVVKKAYPIPTKVAYGGPQKNSQKPAGPVMPKGISPALGKHLQNALAGQPVTFQMPNNRKAFGAFQKMAQKQGVQVTIQGNQATLTKAS